MSGYGYKGGFYTYRFQKGAVEYGEIMIQPLIDLIRNDEYYDPLFPGYGMAPLHAAQCLDRLGNEKAIVPLFETLGRCDFFVEETLLYALKSLGHPARNFLLKILESRPFTEDNERAALALVLFQEDPEVVVACKKQLDNTSLPEEFKSYLELIVE